MKILLINAFDKGGAANSCKRLHLGLLSKKINSKVLLKSKQNNWLNSFNFVQFTESISKIERLEKKIKRILKKYKVYSLVKRKDEAQEFLNFRPAGLEMFSFPDSGIDLTHSDLYKEADIINLHWVANFLDYQSFFKKNIKPIVWTLHDMNPFSGGEHYWEEYIGIDESGFPIRREYSKEELRVARKIIALKKQVMSKVYNLTIVAPSEWLAEEARKSEVFKGKTILCIPNGLDPKIYSTRDKNYARELLGIPRDKKVILFVADSISNNRKGFAFLMEAFKQLEQENISLCTVGNSEGFGTNMVLELGAINDENLMSYVFSAADVFVIPSLMDNLPNTVLESLMCGTPVIGFPVGGIPDMIQDGINGFLTNEISVVSLYETLNKFLTSTEKFDRNKIRKEAIEKYDQKVQAKKYIDLFQKILIDTTSK